MINSSNNKYKFLSEEKRVTLPDKRKIFVRRIQAIRNIEDKDGNIVAKKGEKGGFVQSQNNLSVFGGAWVKDEAVICDEAVVYQDGLAAERALVFHYGSVSGHAKVLGDSCLFEKGVISGMAQMKGKSKLHGHAKVYGSAVLDGEADVAAFYEICGDQKISENLSQNPEESIELGA